jgi:hypothetical protein
VEKPGRAVRYLVRRHRGPGKVDTQRLLYRLVHDIDKVSRYGNSEQLRGTTMQRRANAANRLLSHMPVESARSDPRRAPRIPQRAVLSCREGFFYRPIWRPCTHLESVCCPLMWKAYD